MSLLTSFLKLFKWNTSDENDLNSQFNIEKSLNENWDKIDSSAKQTNNAIINIQDDIEDLQATNTNQDELIQKLKDNSINITTEEATQIHVEDASELPARLEVRGNHTQKTVKGIQILENTNQGTTGWGMATSPSGLGVMEEVSYLGTRACKFKTTAEATSWMYISRNVNLSKLKNNTTYTLQMDVKTNYNEGTINIYIQDGTATNTLVDFGYVNNVNGERRIKLVATTNDTEIANQILYIGLYALDNNSSNELIITNLILVEGDYSDTDLEWEEYTGLQGSPSLDYPSEVRAVGDNVNVFDGSDTYSGYVNGEIGQSINYYSTNLSVTYKKCCKLYQEKNYVVSFNKNTLGASNVRICLLADEDDNVLEKYQFNPNDEKWFINPSETGYLYLVTDINATEIKIEEGTEATSYSQYGQGSVEIKKYTANQLNLSNASAYNVNYTIENDKLVISTDGIHGSNNIEVDILELFKRNTGKNIAFQFEKLEISNIDAMNMIVVQIHTINNEVHNYQSIVRKDGSRYEYVIPKDVEGLTFAKLQIFANNSNDIINNSVSITKPMLLLAKTTDATVTYQRYEESSYILQIQKPMLQGDYFDLARGKEVHVWKEIILNGTENYEKMSNNRYMYVLPLECVNEYYQVNCISNKLKSETLFNLASTTEVNLINTNQQNAYIKPEDEISTVEQIKNLLQGNPVKVYYKLATPEELELTEEQKAVLQQLSELDLFKGTNNIITTESLALLQMSYIADTQSYIDSQIDEKLANINTQILELAGGN